MFSINAITSRYVTISAVLMLVAYSVDCQAQQGLSTRFDGREAQNVSPQYQPTQRVSRMKVVEGYSNSPLSDGAEQQKSYITVVGAVRRSGVYETSGPNVCLKDLVEAAGGLSHKASPSIRIIRNGYLRAQVYYSEQCTDDLKPQDIVVVVSKPVAFMDVVVQSELIPVACVGLDQRPVVLPLEPSIATIDDLANRLLQRSEVAESAIVLDPLGRRLQSRLVPGSIIFFNSQKLNLAALDRVKQQQPFPGIYPLTPFDPDAETAQPVEAPPATLQTMMLPEGHAMPLVAAQQVENSFQVAQQHADIVASRDSNARFESQHSDSTAQVASSSMAQASPSLLVPLSIFHEPNSVVTIEESPTLPEDQSTEYKEIAAVPDQHSLMLPKFSTHEQVPQRSAGLQEESAQTLAPEVMSNTRSIKYETEDAGQDSSESALTIEAIPTLVEPPATSTIETPIPFAEVAPLPPVEEQSLQMAGKSGSTSSYAALRVPVQKTQSWIPVAMGVGLLSVLCLGVSLLWSHHDRQQTRKLFQTQYADDRDISLEANTVKTEIEEVLDHSFHIIEEQVIVPENIPLHGEPVGHRRMIIHDRHETVAGPHFSRKKHTRPKVKVGAKFNERELRNSLKDAIGVSRPFNTPVDYSLQQHNQDSEGELEQAESLELFTADNDQDPSLAESLQSVQQMPIVEEGTLLHDVASVQELDFPNVEMPESSVDSNPHKVAILQEDLSNVQLQAEEADGLFYSDFDLLGTEVQSSETDPSTFGTFQSVRCTPTKFETSRYDIVQPEQKKTETIGPLERALKAISNQQKPGEIHS